HGGEVVSKVCNARRFHESESIMSLSHCPYVDGRTARRSNQAGGHDGHQRILSAALFPGGKPVTKGTMQLASVESVTADRRRPSRIGAGSKTWPMRPSYESDDNKTPRILRGHAHRHDHVEESGVDLEDAGAHLVDEAEMDLVVRQRLERVHEILGI